MKMELGKKHDWEGMVPSAPVLMASVEKRSCDGEYQGSCSLSLPGQDSSQ